MFHYPAELQHNSRGGGGPHAPPVQHCGPHTQVPPLREVRATVHRLLDNSSKKKVGMHINFKFKGLITYKFGNQKVPEKYGNQLELFCILFTEQKCY
jgi:hypothetical protein